MVFGLCPSELSSASCETYKACEEKAYHFGQ